MIAHRHATESSYGGQTPDRPDPAPPGSENGPVFPEEYRLRPLIYSRL